MHVKDCNFVAMKQLLLVFFLSAPLLFFAQQITMFGHCYVKGKQAAVGAQIQLKVIDNRSVNTPAETTTDQQGYYAFQNVQVGQLIELHYFFEGTELTFNTLITDNKISQELPDQNFAIQDNRGVIVRQEGQNPFEIEKLPHLNLKGIVGLERTLTLTTAATSNNELTSNYNVRGGNYDENLVYVNGFQVFRPFLT